MMNDETVNARLVDYLGRYTTFAMPASESRRRAGTTTSGRAVPGSAARSIGGSVLALAVIAALVVILGVGFGLRSRTLTTQPETSSLFSGARATNVANPRDNYVWFTATSAVASGTALVSQAGTEPAPRSQPGLSATGLRVAVVDWTGAVRYHFTIDRSRLDPNVLPEIELISTDGTRALLNDGTVINQTGAVVGTIRDLANATGTPRWTSDARDVCAASDSGGRLALRVYSLDGTNRLIASIPDPANGEIVQAPIASVLSCSPESNLAVVARPGYNVSHTHACSTPELRQCTMTSITLVPTALWAIRMSSGALAFHEPTLGFAGFETVLYASENGALAAESLWHMDGKQSFDSTAVRRVPSGSAVPGLLETGLLDLPAVSADGMLVLATAENVARTVLSINLVSALDGHVIRTVAIRGSSLLAAGAAAYPEGSSFMIDVDGELALLDSRGGISRLATSLDLVPTPADANYLAMSQAQR